MCKAVLLSQTEWWPKWDLSNSNFPPFCLFWIAVSQCKHWKNCFWPIRICFDLKTGGKFKKDKWFLGHPSIWFIISALIGITAGTISDTNWNKYAPFVVWRNLSTFRTRHSKKWSVKFNDIFWSCSLMEFIDILSDNDDFFAFFLEPFFSLSNGNVCWIWLLFQHDFSAIMIKFPY